MHQKYNAEQSGKDKVKMLEFASAHLPRLKENGKYAVWKRLYSQDTGVSLLAIPLKSSKVLLNTNFGRKKSI